MQASKTLRFKMDEEWRDVPGGVETFGELREWVVDELRSRGLVLLGILNGERTVTQAEVAECRDRRLLDFGTLEFLSADPADLSRRICADMIGVLDKLEKRAEQTAGLLKDGQSKGGLVGLKDCAEAWSTLLQTYRDLLLLSGTDPSTVEIDGRSFAAVANDLKELLEKMGRDFENKDMNAVCDLLVHDLGYYVPPLREAFESLREKLG